MKTNLFHPRSAFLAVCAMFFLSLLTLNSCEKDALDATTETVNGEVTFRNAGDGDIDYSVAEALLNEINFGAISINEELQTLQFASDADLQQTLDLLEQADEALNAEIYSSIEGLPEEEVDQMEILDDFAFETFENNFPGFTSFRKNAATVIEEFFSQEELNDEEDPSDAFDAIPDVIGAVMNVHGEVVSADDTEFDHQVHISRTDGGNYSVLDGDLATVMDIRAGLEHSEIEGLPNVEIVDTPEFALFGGPKCRSNKSKTKYHYIYQSGKKKYRARLKVQIYNFSFLWWNTHRASSQLRSRKKSGWWWKKHYTSIYINQQGNVYPSTYYTAPCTKYYYDYDQEKWVAYETTCTYERKCDGEALNAASAGSAYAWDYSRVRNYSMKVSASDKDGYPGTLRASFTWKGNNYSLSIF